MNNENQPAPTPETDNHARVYQTAGMPFAYSVLLGLSRKLERERDQLCTLSASMQTERDVAVKRYEHWRKAHEHCSESREVLIAERDQLRKVCDELAVSLKGSAFPFSAYKPGKRAGRTAAAANSVSFPVPCFAACPVARLCHFWV